VIVFTGEGKGKTSAAMGVALRASGHGMHVSVVQFIKKTSSGECIACGRLTPEVEIIVKGSGFVNLPSDAHPLSEHKKAAAEALDMARGRIYSGSWNIVVLDEVNTALSLGLIELEAVLNLLADRPPRVDVILTGRGAPQGLIAAADMVTEMRSIKHPFDKGIPARKGIDY
jgi:cob(I)alamin adenosyltransferase